MSTPTNQRILVIDDDKEELEFIQEAFADSEGLSLQVFAHSISALQYLQNQNNGLPSLIITDFRMPTIDGFNVVSFIKRNERFRNIPIVVLANNLSPFEKDRLTDAGVIRTFSKPDSPDGYAEIARELRSLLQ